MSRKTYTDTEAGKFVLEYVSYSVPTLGMEVYKCDLCDELFACKSEFVTEYETCGVCDQEIKYSNYDFNEHEEGYED